ncbi:DNA-binding response regulator [Corynebacterium sp. 13CS0277]|uniref:response regulator transcription factor n=1 Tax=Corynebacterium sp. 13CS0277 TaxID=2071994 RepID=UPI000D033A44|nr:response regulator transcription factor [Corynebacterium sp. 13CS0277]PRQ12136.1 DNA-binding response regulator [Corynebacterium sp. 13CS0277]
MIRVLIADDQALVRGALAALLQLEDDIDVVAQCADGRDVVDAIIANDVDVALLDVDMPHTNGIDATAQIRDARVRCRVLMVTTFGRPGYVRKALDAGAHGFVVKDTPPDELAGAIRKLHCGLRYIDPELAQEACLHPGPQLTSREEDICRLVLRGHDAKEIAAQLYLSHGTVRNHISAIIAKTGASNRFAAARIARDLGWLLD